MKLSTLFPLVIYFVSHLSVNAQEEKISPNVIIILTDDMGYADVGFNGCLDIPTPNIDKLAQNGVVFTNGYVSYCACGPSRAGLITGRYQDRFGFSRNPLFAPNDPEMGLPLSEETLADVLNKADYSNFAVGKWHLGSHETLHPLKRGFDDFYGFLSGGHQYFPELYTLADAFEAKSQFDGYNTKLLRNYERVDETEYLTDALTREAVSYIEKKQEEPFFIYLAYNAPHAPLQATEKYLERFDHIKDKKRKTYAAMVSAVDDGVGLVQAKLDELNLTDNTIIVFLSDNGGPERHNASDNGALRGQKGELFEGGIRVPFAMQWTNKIPAGTVYNNPVISLDIFATVIAYIQKQVVPKNKIDGVNLIPYITGQKSGEPHEFLFWRKFDEEEFAVRNKNNKLLVYGNDKMLYDLQNDIGEQDRLEAVKKSKSTRLQNALDNWNENMEKPRFLGLSHDSIYNTLNPDRFQRK